MIPIYEETLNPNPFYSENNQTFIFVHNEKVVDQLITTALSISVVGIYITVIYTIGKFIRIFFEKIS